MLLQIIYKFQYVKIIAIWYIVHVQIVHPYHEPSHCTPYLQVKQV